LTHPGADFGKVKLLTLNEVFYTVRIENLHQHVMLDEKHSNGSALAAGKRSIQRSYIIQA
jgi:hypothetical protein